MVPLRYNVRSLMVRKATTFATAGGIALVVFVFAAALMLGEGTKRAFTVGGRADTLIVLRKGSDAELSSTVNNETLSLLQGRPELAPNGAIGELVIVVTGEIADGSGASNVLVRGMPASGMAFRPEARIVSGRAPKPGTHEVIVGRAISGRFKGIAPGQRFDLRRNRPLVVVGEFETGGSSHESEVWGDLEVIQKYLGREGVVSSARLRLANPGQFDAFRASVEADKRLNVKVQRELDYFRKQSEQTAGFLSGMGLAIAILFALAAMIGAAITMNGAVANRTKEIGTLRALGFSRLAILSSFVFEAICLALVGGAVGTAFVMLLSLKTFPVMNFQTFSEIVIGFHATPGVVIGSLVFSCVMGLIGGLVPALRASRVSPVEAMRG